MTNKGSLVVVSGFSGVGKGTVMKSLITRHEGYALSVSATTRAPRDGEVDGRDYFFVTEEAFTGMIRQNALIEHAVFCDHFYGTPKVFVEEQLEAGKNVILEIEIQGARLIRKQFPDALMLFIMPPSALELSRRLTDRGTENDSVIRDRLRRAVRESEGIEDYDYIFVNDDADVCADEIDQLIRAVRHKTERNMDFIEDIRAQIKAL